MSVIGRNKKIFRCLVMVFLISLMLLNVIQCYAATDSTVGRVRLNIETYLAGQNQPTHPAVVAFDDEWNGYKYWMVYTPYPESDGEEENPSIAVSNDLYKWETPYGTVNPIADNEETGCNELKDAHILYRKDLDRLEVWYLGRVSENLGGDGTSLMLFRKVSSDGITWSDYEIIDKYNYVSPTVLWDGNKYRMWSIGFSALSTGGTLAYQESEDGKTWTAPKLCNIEGNSSELKLWHGAVSYDQSEGKYIFVYIQSSGSSQTIESCVSEDAINFSQVQTIVRNDDQTIWDRFYRPFLLIDSKSEKYHLFYGVITKENKWYISYSHGDSLSTLKGISESDHEKMVQLDDIVYTEKSTIDLIKDCYEGIRNSFKPEILAASLLFVVIHKVVRKKGRLSDLSICLASIIVCTLFTLIAFRPADFLSTCPIILTGLIEGISVYGISVAIYRFIRNQ